MINCVGLVGVFIFSFQFGILNFDVFPSFKNIF